MGAGVAALPESSAAGSSGTAVRAACVGLIAGDSEDRRYLLSKAVDGCHAEQPAIARGGGYGQAVSGGPSGDAAAAPMGGAECGRRSVPRGEAGDHALALKAPEQGPPREGQASVGPHIACTRLPHGAFRNESLDIASFERHSNLHQIAAAESCHQASL